MFEHHIKREAAEALNRRRFAIIAGMWANPNLDGEEADRAGALDRADQITDEAINSIYSGKVEEPDEIPFDDPLFAPMKQTVYSPEFDQLVAASTGKKEKFGKFEVALIEEKT